MQELRDLMERQQQFIKMNLQNSAGKSKKRDEKVQGRMDNVENTIVTMLYILIYVKFVKNDLNLHL